MSSQQPMLRSSDTSELHVFTHSANFPKKPDVITPTPTMPESVPDLLLEDTASDTSIESLYNGDNHPRLTIDFSFNTLLFKMNEMKQDQSFIDNGYKKLHKLCNTLQGELYKAQNISNGQYVAIKKTNKSLFAQNIAIQDDINFCVSENIIKEGLILKYLTVDNIPIGNHIIKYIDSFQDDTDYYLVMEYIESQTNLKQFVAMAHKYILQNKLQLKQYQKVIKYLYWQLIVTIRWMHHDMKCCHLDLCMENIMLQNCTFIEEKDGYLMINPSISIKLCDFGVAETFRTDTESSMFICNKTELSIENESYLAPKIFSEELYDARSADVWSLGMILFECLCGEPLYKPMDIWSSDCIDVMSNGYYALHNGCLKQYLVMNKVLKYFNNDSLMLFLKLVNVNECQRLDAVSIIRDKWFRMYFKRYYKQIERKSICQRKKFIKERNKMSNLPFYSLA